jgi:hypothetical protein
MERSFHAVFCWVLDSDSVVPKTVTTAPVNTKAAEAVPALKPYRFAMVQKKLIIVNPLDHKIAEVITG